MTKARLLLFLLSVAAFSAIAFKRLSFNVDPLDLLPQDLQEVEGVREFVGKFAAEGLLITSVHAGNDVDPEDLAAAVPSLVAYLEEQDDLVQRIDWRPIWESDPVAAAQLPAYLWLNGKPARVAGLAERLAEGNSQQAIADALEELSFSVDPQTVAFSAYDPFGLLRPGAIDEGAGLDLSAGDGKYTSADGLMRVIYITPPASVVGYREADDWIGRLNAAIEEWRNTDGERISLRITHTGEPAFEAEIGTGMQSDMTGSIVGAVALIHLLFFLMHRRMLPLVAMFLSLALILAVSVVLGSFLFGKLSVMSVGFAAILVGLAVDYGVVLYQEARQGDGSAKSLRKAVGPSILWAALTTAAVFASLGMSSLPGIRELGWLVAMGIVFGALVMLWVFAPMAAALGAANPLPEVGKVKAGASDRRMLAVTVGLVLLVGGILSMRGLPSLYTSFDALRPRDSAADAAFNELGAKLSGRENLGLPVLVRGSSRDQLIERAGVTVSVTDELRGDGTLKSLVLVPDLIPNAATQLGNRASIASILAAEKRLLAELDEVFGDEAKGVLVGVFSAWRAMISGNVSDAALPPSPAAQRMMAESYAESGDSFALLGLVEVAEGRYQEARSAFRELDGTFLTGWPTIGPAVRPLVLHDLTHVFLPMAVVLLVMLTVVFRNARDVAMAVSVIVVSSGLLLGLMSLLGWQWDLLNLCAFPLLLGTGIDYTVHMIAALRRHQGARLAIRRGIARALLFCGLSTAVGFGSLAMANNAGLASLGRVCAAGILITMVVAVVFLPAWWRACQRGSVDSAKAEN